LQVCYKHVAETVPKLLSSHGEHDIFLHIGLAASRSFFALERQSFREPYWEIKDIDGETFSKEETLKLFKDCPRILKPTFNCDDVWRRWRSNLSTVSPNADIRPSDDPGNYLCGFVYYLSMSEFWKRGAEERPVMFMHVPDCPTAAEVEEGKKIAVGLIRALVDSREKLGTVDPMESDAVDKVDYVMGGAELQIPSESRWSGI
jgi:pyroglutamyl-peptidase